MRLNVGCGRAPLEGWTNADLFPGPGVDLVFDAGARWPLPDASQDAVRMWGVLEHLPRWEDAVAEAARVLRPGGRLDIMVPDGWRGLCQPYHVRGFTLLSFDVFCGLRSYRDSDLRKRPLDGPPESLELPERPWFRKVSARRVRHYPFAWHLARLIGPVAYRLPLGRTRNLEFVLARREDG